MLGHADGDRGQVEHLTARNGDLGCSRESSPAPPAACRLAADHLVGVGHLLQRLAQVPALTTGLSPGLPPQRLRGWLAGLPRPSEDGGFEEFRDDAATCRSSSAIRASWSAIRASWRAMWESCFTK